MSYPGPHIAHHRQGARSVALFSGSRAKPIAILIDRLADAALSWVREGYSVATDLAEGTTGVALFLGYYGWLARRDECLDTASGLLGTRLDSNLMRRPWLYSGASGVAWVAAHLARVTQDSRFACDDSCVRYAIVDQLATVPSDALRGRHELMRGLTGLGIYALEWPNDQLKERCLSLLLAHLHATAINDGCGIYWGLTTPASAVPSKAVVTLGPAHGVMGPLCFLGRMACNEAFSARAQSLVEDGMRWLMNTGARHCVNRVDFPDWVDITGRQGGVQSGWCNGDHGIAASIALLGWLLNRPDWSRYAADLSIRASAAAEARMSDACLCHGAAGVSHLLNRVRILCARDDAEELSRAWYERTLELAQPQGSFPFLHWTLNDVTRQGERSRKVGLLTGLAGIGLALLSSITDRDLEWDRALLVSA